MRHYYNTQRQEPRGKRDSSRQCLPSNLATDTSITPDTHNIPPKTETTTTADPLPSPPQAEHPATHPASTPTESPQNTVAEKPEGTADKTITPDLTGPKEQ
eukprot:437772-Karenia_brevis.AAC.1